MIPQNLAKCSTPAEKSSYAGLYCKCLLANRYLKGEFWTIDKAPEPGENGVHNRQYEH